MLVGFAAETNDVIANAQKKLAAKRVDLIVANDVAEAGAGFAVDTNHVTLVDAAGAHEVAPGPKSEVAHRILDRVIPLLSRSAAPVPGTARTARGSRPRPARAARRPRAR